MSLKYDFHIHTKYLKCANETMEVRAIVDTCMDAGCSRIGIADHLNRPDQIDTHRLIRDDIAALGDEAGIDVFFGVELNFTGCDGTFIFDEEIKERMGVQYAIGGIHSTYCDEYDLQKIIEIQHRHHIKTCEDPLVDVLVHPYWFSYRNFMDKEWPWFESVTVVPEKLTRELGQVARETHTAIEINGDANLQNAVNPPSYRDEYIDYLSILNEEGVMFSFGSDAHDVSKLQGIHAVWEAVDRMGVPDERIWSP